MERKVRIKMILMIFLLVIVACGKIKQEEKTVRDKVKDTVPDMEQRAEDLRKDGFEVFLLKEGDSTYLMQEYYMVFLKSGQNREQDSAKVAELMRQHLAHLSRMASEGYASLIGPFSDDGPIRGIVVFQTPDQEMADSLAKLDPMVKAGRLEVEVHPWWTEKGGRLR